MSGTCLARGRSDRSAESRSLILSFDASANFTIVDVVSSIAEIDSYLEERRAWMALTIPAGFGRLVREGRPAAVQVIADGSDANSTNVALGYTTNLVSDYSQSLIAASPAGQLAARGVSAHLARPAGIQPSSGVVQLASRKPVLHASGIGRSCCWRWTTTCLRCNRAGEGGGTLEQLSVTPWGGSSSCRQALRTRSWALSTWRSRSWWFCFGSKCRCGAASCFVSHVVIYLLTTLGLGLFVSTISQTQQQP